MTESAITPRHLPGGRFASFGEFAIALLLSGTLAFFCYCSTGNSLDLFLGGLFLSAIMIPPLTAFAGRTPGVAVAVCLGIGCSWLMPVLSHAISLGQLVSCLMVLASFIAALWSLSILGIPPAIVVTTAIAWLTWPIWLSATLPGSRAHLSVLFHPLFAINHVVDNLGIWTEQQGMYGLTTLGQDVQYQLPGSAWPAILFHLGVAVVAFITSTFMAPRSMNQIDTDASTVKIK